MAHVEAVAAQLATGSATVEEEPVGLCDLPGFDPPGTRRRLARTIKTFDQWIEHEPLERWSLLHDTHGARYGAMTTNLAETYNLSSEETKLCHLQRSSRAFSMA